MDVYMWSCVYKYSDICIYIYICSYEDIYGSRVGLFFILPLLSLHKEWNYHRGCEIWYNSLVIIGQTASVRLVVSYCWVVPQRCLPLGLISRTGGVFNGSF